MIFFFAISYFLFRNPQPVEPKSKWKKATTKIKTLNALTTQYSDEHMREDIGDAVVISEDQAQCSNNFQKKCNLGKSPLQIIFISSFTLLYRLTIE